MVLATITPIPRRGVLKLRSIFLRGLLMGGILVQTVF